MLIWYSQEARSYAVLVFFCAVSLLFFARALRTRDKTDLSLWALASALALCSHYFAFFAIGIEAVWLLVALRFRWRVLAAVGAVGVVGLALVPLLLAQVNPTHIGWIDRSLLSTRFLQTGVSFLAGETGHVIAEPPRERYAVVPVILIGAAWLLVAARGTWRERRGALLGAAVGLGVALLSLAAALVGKDYVVERNLLPALLPLGIAAAIGFGAERASRLGLLLAVLLCAYWVGFGIRVTQTPNLQRPDFRGVVDELGPSRWPARDRQLETRRRACALLPARPRQAHLQRRHAGPRDRRDQQADRRWPDRRAEGLPRNRTGEVRAPHTDPLPVRPDPRNPLLPAAQHPHRLRRRRGGRLPPTGSAP